MTARGDWVGYYDAQGDREPRDLLIRAMRLFDREGRVGTAVDLGCGQGIESAALLSRGWNVVAIDAQPEAIERLRARVPADALPRLTTRVSRMEDSEEIPPCDLVHASFSLPFCSPAAFPDLWDRVRGAIGSGGRFVGELFGDRDSWATDPEMTFFDIDGARALFDGWALESFLEEEEDGEAWDEQKHWHVFHAIARRPA
jgi:tellurite methyltransferase